MHADDTLFEHVGGGEAWTEFRDQVNDLKIEGSDNLTGADIEKVLDIIDNEPDPARRERRLRTLDRGRVYNILRNELLSDQRNSGYICIYYDYVPDETARDINRAIELTREGRHAEALSLLEEVKGDPRSWLAYSTSLYYNDHVEEAVAVLERLARATLPDGSLRPEAGLAGRNLEQMRDVIDHNKEIGKPIYLGRPMR